MCWVALAVVPWRGTIGNFTLMESPSLRPFSVPKASETSVSREQRNMMWKMAIGWWRLIQKKHEQWSIWRLVRRRDTLIVLVQPPGGFWEESGPRWTLGMSFMMEVSVQDWCHSDEGSSEIINITFWKNEYSQKWNKCSITWNLIQVRNQFADTFHLENSVLICSSSTLNTFQSYRTECEISDHYPARNNTQRIHFSSVCTMLMLTNPLFAINTSLLWVAMVTEFWVAQGRCNNQ